jgi:hypothetical protein
MKQQLKVVKKPENSPQTDSAGLPVDNIMHSADLDSFITKQFTENEQKQLKYEEDGLQIT